jgi:hypothetical protein
MIVIKGQDIDVILGMNWLAQNKAIINADQRTIQLSHGQEEVKLSIPISVPVKESGQVFEAIVQEIQIFRLYVNSRTYSLKICPGYL